MAIMNKIDVQACDNELIILASTAAQSSELCRLKSGYNAPVSDVFNPGHILPKGNYELTVIGVNWGGPSNFKVICTDVNGQSQTLQGGGSTAAGVTYQKTIPMQI
jgi:hypothetical protein